MRRFVPTTIYNILSNELVNLQAAVDNGTETIYLFWGDRAIGKTVAAEKVAEEFPNVWYVPLTPFNTKSESAFVRGLVEAMGKPIKWGMSANLKVLTEEVGKQVFILDNAEELFNLKSRTPKTPPLLRVLKFLVERGHGFALLSNEDVPPKLAVYKEVWKRIRKVVKFETLYKEDLEAFAKAYGIKLKDLGKVFVAVSKVGLTAIDLDEIFYNASLNGFEELGLKEFKTLLQLHLEEKKLVTA